MVDMGVAHDHGIDVLRIDAGLLHRREELAGGRPEILGGAHSGVEKDELVAGVEDEDVLLEDGVVRRQEVVGELLVHLRRRQALEAGMGVAERQRAVGDDRRLGVAELEAVIVRRRGIDHRRLRGRAPRIEGDRARGGARGGAEQHITAGQQRALHRFLLAQ
jgi:hypothetical protein